MDANKTNLPEIKIQQGLTLLKNSPKEFYKAMIVPTATVALKSETPCIAEVKKNLGEQYALAFLVIVIIDISKYFNVGKSMNQEQVAETARLIMQKYPYYKPEEFKYCFNKAKSGDYGEVFDRIDGQILFSWLNRYDTERDNSIFEMRENENKEYKSANGLGIHSKYIPLVKTIVENIENKTNQKNNKMSEPTTPRERTENEKLYDSWYAEFAKLEKDQKTTGFVKYKERNVNIDEFIVAKIEEFQKSRPKPIDIPKLSQGWMIEFDNLFRQQNPSGNEQVGSDRTVNYKGFDFTIKEFLEAKTTEATGESSSM